MASTEAVFNDQYDCLKCHNRHKDESLRIKQQDLKSCRKSGDFRFQLSNIQFRRCPGNYVLPQVNYLLSIFHNYQKFGHIDGINLIDSTHKLYQIISIIENVVEFNREKIRKKEIEKSKRKR